jgi:hypothetical protein
MAEACFQDVGLMIFLISPSFPLFGIFWGFSIADAYNYQQSNHAGMIPLTSWCIQMDPVICCNGVSIHHFIRGYICWGWYLVSHESWRFPCYGLQWKVLLKNKDDLKLPPWIGDHQIASAGIFSAWNSTRRSSSVNSLSRAILGKPWEAQG